MISNIISDLKNKKILILGFGIEGKSTYSFIRRHLKEQKLYIYDTRDYEEIGIKKYIESDKNLIAIKKQNNYDFLSEYDFVIKSPGISFKGINTENFIGKITSQVELFLKHTNNLTIGITGTKGKSTTSSLLYAVLKNQKTNAKLVGNIGTPIFDEIENIKTEDVFVIELSSHQLQYIKHSPHISILLNIFEDHLDHYNSFMEYANSKINILKYQKDNDFAVVNLDNKLECDILKQIKIKSKVLGVTQNNDKKDKLIKTTVQNVDNTITIFKEGKIKKVYDLLSKRNLIGKNNEFNIMAVFAVVDILGLNFQKASETINKFKGLSHRMEYIGEYNNIKYYDDSIATIPEATIAFIEALEDIDTVILGGLDRNINYDYLIEYLSTKEKLSNIICMYETGKKIYNMLKDTKKVDEKIVLVNDIYEAVDIAKKKTKKNKSCILSPAAASYGDFKNFEERGEIFKKLVSTK